MIDLFDVQCGFGGHAAGKTEVFSPEELLAEMDRLQIGQALVRIEPDDLDVDWQRSNDRLFEACRGRGRLVPCPVIAPGDEFGGRCDEQAKIDALIARGARAAVIRPQRDAWQPLGFVCDGLLAAAETHGLAVLCPLSRLSLAELADLAGRHPAVPLVIIGADYGSNRTLVPLLETFANTLLSIGPNFTEHGGIEAMVARIGPERLLFGTGLPAAEAMAAITQLMYADIPESQKRMIGGGNLRRLLGERRDAHSPRVQGGLATGETPVLREARTVSDHALSRGRRGECLADLGIIDIHAHLGRCWFPIALPGAAGLVAVMDRVGIAQTAVSHLLCLGGDVAWGNDQIAQAMADFPGRILGYAALFPSSAGEVDRETARRLEQGFIGLKLHNANGFSYLHENYAPGLAIADHRRRPVVLHTWGQPAEFDQVRQLAGRYPGASFILAHAGCVNLEGYAGIARECANVYLDTCFSRAPRGLVRRLVESAGADKVLWGSDCNFYSLTQQIGRVLGADLDEPTKLALLRDNARRLLGQIT